MKNLFLGAALTILIVGGTGVVHTPPPGGIYAPGVVHTPPPGGIYAPGVVHTPPPGGLHGFGA